MLKPRPPVVAILGHVDHGKTTLLDYIRRSNVAGREFGGITQKISVCQVKKGRGAITFIDTPGHEVFTKMRQKGVSLTDIAVLVVSATDGVMPQTKESLEYIKSSGAPLIVAINKTDLLEADIAKVKNQLGEAGVVFEEFGGEAICVPVSGKTGKGVDKLLETILTLAEVRELKADPEAAPEIAILESGLHPKKGPMATIIVLAGTLKPGANIVISGRTVKIKALFDEAGKQITAAGPGTPAEILGPESVFKPGETGEAKKKERPMELISLPENDKPKIILVCDTVGSIEAIKEKLADAEVLEEKTGEINESEVLLAKAVGAIIIGFNIGVSSAATKLAETEKVKIYTFRIVYELLDFYFQFKKGLIKEEKKEEILGRAKIIAEFPFNSSRIAGIRVLGGRIARGDNVRIEREGETVRLSRIKSIKQQKEEISKIETGGEGGILLAPQLDFIVGDMIISYRTK